MRDTDGSTVELEELGEGQLRARFEHGISKDVKERIVSVQQLPELGKVLEASKHIVNGLR